MHIPVLLREVLGILNPQPGQIFIDATIGGGGHSEKILEKISPGGTLLGIDLDRKELEETRERLLKFNKENKVILECSSHTDLKILIEKHGLGKIDGILFDLGFGTHSLAAGRGFSFQTEEILDMRYSLEATALTAREVLNEWSKEELERIFREYGEERFSRRIAEKIAEERRQRPINTTAELVRIVSKAMPKFLGRSRRNPATRIFQALRLAVNHELENLERVLPEALEILVPSGRIAVISFHSLEDRIIKRFFKERSKKGEIEILTPKPISPSRIEININPRSRSAKLRAARKI